MAFPETKNFFAISSFKDERGRYLHRALIVFSFSSNRQISDFEPNHGQQFKIAEHFSRRILVSEVPSFKACPAILQRRETHSSNG